MDLITCTAFFVSALFSLSHQSYTEISTTTIHDGAGYLLSQNGFSIKETKLIFAVKICYGGTPRIGLQNAQAATLYYLAIHSSESKVALGVTNGSYIPEYNATHLDCQNFTHFKFQWGDGNFGVWIMEQSSWKLALSWQETNTNVHFVKDVELGSWGTDADWRVFITNLLGHSCTQWRRKAGGPGEKQRNQAGKNMQPAHTGPRALRSEYSYHCMSSGHGSISQSSLNRRRDLFNNTYLLIKVNQETTTDAQEKNP